MFEKIFIKDLPNDQQEKYHNFLLSMKQQQEEFVDKFTYVSIENEEDDGEYTEDEKEIWDQYIKQYDNDVKDNPCIDEWKWQSSSGGIVLKDMYYFSSDRMEGVIFFVLNGKIQIACLNDGYKMMKIREDNDLNIELNQQLVSFNYARTKRITWDVRKYNMLL